MNKLTKIFNNIGFYCSLNNDNFIQYKSINGYKLLDSTSVGYYIPYLVRNTKDNYKWEIGVGEVQHNDGTIVIKRVEVSSSSDANKKVNFTGNENEFYLFVNNNNFNSSFNNVILKNDNFTIDNITSIYLVDNTDKNIDCVLPQVSEARNIVIDIKALSNLHNVIIRHSDGSIFNSTNSSTRLVCDGQTWYILNENDKTDHRLLSDDTFSAQANPGGSPYSFQYNDGSNGLLGSELYWSSGNTNKLLLGSSSESLAHSIIPTSGNANTIFNQDLKGGDFIVYGSGQNYRNLFFSYDGRVGVNIPSGSRPQTIFHVVNYSCSEILRLENRTSCQPAKLTIYHKPSGLSNGNICSIVNLAGRDSNNNQKDYAQLYSIATNTTDGFGGVVLSVSSGNNQQSIISGTLDNINVGYNNNNALNISNNGDIRVSGSSIELRSSSTNTIGTSNTYAIFNNSNRNITLDFNTLSFGSGAITSNGTLSANNLTSNSITLPNISPSSLLTLSDTRTLIPISGITINSSNNGLVLNNISGNKFLTTDSNKNIVGLYDLDDYFLTEKDIVWNKFSPRSCSVCLKQVVFDSLVPQEEFAVGDQIEINSNNTLIYRTIVSLVLDDNNISELLLDQNVTSTTTSGITVLSITKGGYLTIQKSTTDVVSSSTSNILSVRPFTETVFNTAQKDIDFVVYGTKDIPALKVWANIGSTTQQSGIYYSYATASSNIAPIPVNVGGSGINNNFSSANFSYTPTNNVFSGILSTIGSNGLDSYYGTYDQNGNVAEWVEPDPIESNSSTQYAAGGSYQTSGSIQYLRSVEIANIASGYAHIGFRVASTNLITDSNTISSINQLNFSFSTIHDNFNVKDTGTLYLRSSDIPTIYNSVDIFPNLGRVNESYRISKYETTNNQYARFLNIVATGNNFTSSGLYDSRMSSEDTGGIIRTYNGLIFNYTTKANMSNKPVNFVSYINSLKYVNWLHNGTPSEFIDKSIEEVLEDGAYSILRSDSTYSIIHNNNRKYFLPSIHQWHKAAYFEPKEMVLVSGKPVTTINTDIAHVVATEKLDTISTLSTDNQPVPRQILADLTISGWLVVDKIIVRDGTVKSRLTDLGFTPDIPADPEDTDSGGSGASATPQPDTAPPTPRGSGGSSHSIYWNNNTSVVRLDGVYGEVSPPLPPDGTETGAGLSCTDASLIESNNLPFWCGTAGRFRGPYFYP